MKSFNSDFYVTAATVIPVLYLALTLQGSTFESIIAILKKNAKRMRSEPTSPSATLRLFGWTTLILLGSVSVVSAFSGEGLAILSLYQQQSRPWQEPIVLISMLGLLGTAAAVPLWKYFKTISELLIQVFKYIENPIEDNEGNLDSSPDPAPETPD